MKESKLRLIVSLLVCMRLISSTAQSKVNVLRQDCMLGTLWYLVWEHVHCKGTILIKLFTISIRMKVRKNVRSTNETCKLIGRRVLAPILKSLLLSETGKPTRFVIAGGSGENPKPEWHCLASNLTGRKVPSESRAMNVYSDNIGLHVSK